MSIVSLSPHLGAQRAADGGARREQLQAAAEQFEALFLQQILKQMRKAGDVLAADNPMRSRELDTMRDFYDEVLAETLASKKQMGIADLLVRQLSGDEGQSLDLQQAAAAARSADLPSRNLSLVSPLRGTWQRGLDSIEAAWSRGTASFVALVERVIHHESGGRIDAVSPKGARGIMQLMPDTAREMAAQLGLPFSEARLTSDADYNKQLGSAYLSQMLERYDGEQALAVAAYNAGPGRVDEWLQRHGDPRRGDISVRDWVARIPFQETRDYTQRILTDMQQAPAVPARAQVIPLTRADATERVQQAATDARHGLMLGSAQGKRFSAADADTGRSSVEAQVAQATFKSAHESVALSERAALFTADAGLPPRSAAFAQPIRPGRKEIES